jgi:thiol-disulfide isomerase/thioredoxin
MTDKGPRTATARQGTFIIATVLAVAVVMGFTVLPMFRPARSKLLGLPAPDFTLPVMTGGEPGNRVHLSDLKGKAVVIDFWASWCAPCRAEAPILDRVARRHDGKGVLFLGVATSGDDWARAVEFVKSHGVSYTTLFDENDHVATAFRIQQLPTLVVVGKNGLVRAVRARMVHEDELEELVKDALSADESGT